MIKRVLFSFGMLLGRRWQLRLGIRATIIFFVLVLWGGVCGADGAKFVPRDVISLEKLGFRFSSGSGKHESWKVIRLARIDKKRFLVLLEHSRYRVDPWTDSSSLKQERETQQGLVRSVTFKEKTKSMTLAIVRADGKILDLSDEPSAAESRVAFYPGAHSIPLVIDEHDTCSYAILAPARGVLLCYDLDLHFLGEHQIPLDEIGYPKVTFDGEQHTLWIFGKKLGEARKPAKSFDDVHVSPLEAAEEFGVLYRLPQHSVEPIPIDRRELLARMNRLARDPSGERLQIDPAGVSVLPFRDLDNDPRFWVLVEGLATTEVRSRATLTGTRVFFRARLDSQGLGPLEQLPLWIVQEERDGVLIDEDNGVLRFPRNLSVRDLQPYSLGKTDCALWLQLAFARPTEDQSPPRMFELLQTVAVFRGTGDVPEWIHLEVDPSLKERWTRQLSTGELKVRPLFLLDRVGRFTFAFSSSCKPERGSAFPCYSLMDLEY